MRMLGRYSWSAAALQGPEAICTLLDCSAADRVRHHHHKSWRRSEGGDSKCLSDAQSAH